MPNLNVSIERTRAGEHVIVYPQHQAELIPPMEYEDRLTWIKSSFERFYAQVQELDAIRKTAYIK